MSARALIGIVLATWLVGSLEPAQAFAIPAFARTYGTSCGTCHTVYPKLTPFGEAFRRNGYRFPGVNSDFVKAVPVPLGQEAYKQLFPQAVWPGTLPPSVPIAVGFNGQAVVHPDRKAGGAQADNQARFSMRDLVGEAHIWAGGAYDDTTTFFAELTVADGGAEVEHAQVLFGDLLGPKHAVNAVVGKGPATLSSFGPHSSYVADMAHLIAPVALLFGSTGVGFSPFDNYTGVEVGGVLGGMVNYAVGLKAGASAELHASQDVYGHVGVKFGGMRLDGEGGQGPADAARPWAEDALTLDAFGYHADTHFGIVDAALEDVSNSVGGSLRAQLGSLELNAAVLYETHDHVQSDGRHVTLLTQTDELSYVVYPWLVPAVRLEYLKISPDGGKALTDLRIIPGIAALVRPNLKLTLSAQVERATGAPPAGWGPVTGMAMPSDPAATVDVEVESVMLGLATSF
jgi:hypothetical protein